MTKVSIPAVSELKPAPVFRPGDRVRSTRFGDLGTFIRLDSYGHALVAFDDGLILGEQVIDTVPTDSIGLVPPPPPPPSPSVAELVDLGRYISVAERRRRYEKTIDDLCDMYFGPEFSNGGGEIEWAKRGARS